MPSINSSSSSKGYPSKSNAANMVALFNNDSGSSHGNTLRWNDDDNGNGSGSYQGSTLHYPSRGDGGNGFSNKSDPGRFGVLKGGALSRSTGASSLFGAGGGDGSEPLSPMSPHAAANGAYDRGTGAYSGGNSGNSSRSSFREVSMTPPLHDLLPATPPTDSVTLASVFIVSFDQMNERSELCYHTICPSLLSLAH